MTVLAAVVTDGPVIPDFGTSDCQPNKQFCWDWLGANWPRFQNELIQHVYVSAIAVAIGLVIALPLALLAYRNPRIEPPAVAVTTILYTIPVLGLFLLLIPVTGIGLLTVEIALTGYTLLLLFRNALAGLRSVPAEVRAAALGMGLTPRQILVRISVPLALPAAMAGLRIATVTTISLATLAAYITPLGLGQSILFFIGTQFITGLVTAGLLAILLALVADALVVALTRLVTPWAKARRGGA